MNALLADPVELFLDPAIKAPKLAIGKRLLLRKLGFRTLMDVIPLDASLVRGSHGRPTDNADDGPLVIADQPRLLKRDRVAATHRDELESGILRAVRAIRGDAAIRRFPSRRPAALPEPRVRVPGPIILRTALPSNRLEIALPCR